MARTTVCVMVFLDRRFKDINLQAAAGETSCQAGIFKRTHLTAAFFGPVFPIYPILISLQTFQRQPFPTRALERIRFGFLGKIRPGKAGFVVRLLMVDGGIKPDPSFPHLLMNQANVVTAVCSGALNSKP